ARFGQRQAQAAHTLQGPARFAFSAHSGHPARRALPQSGERPSKGGASILAMPVKRLFMAAVFVGLGAAAAAAGRSLEIYFIDVEGGASTLIVTPAGESVLIDT